LLKRIENRGVDDKQTFGEAFTLLNEAINLEQGNFRVAVHPYVAIFNGAARYLEVGGRLDSKQTDRLLQLISDARYRFRRDTTAQQAAERLERKLP